MKLCVVVCILMSFLGKAFFGSPTFSRASDTNPGTHSPLMFLPENTDPQVRQKLECLRDHPWSEDEIRIWYDRVLNPATRLASVSMDDRIKVWGCFELDDFLKFGLAVEGYTTTTTTTTTATTTPTTTVPPPQTKTSFKVTTNLKTTTSVRKIGTTNRMEHTTTTTKPKIKTTVPKTKTTTSTTKQTKPTQKTMTTTTIKPKIKTITPKIRITIPKTTTINSKTTAAATTIPTTKTVTLKNKTITPKPTKTTTNTTKTTTTLMSKTLNTKNKITPNPTTTTPNSKTTASITSTPNTKSAVNVDSTPGITSSVVLGNSFEVDNVRQQIFECLNSSGWSEDRYQRWYNRVLNPITRVSECASLYDQELVGDCMDADDFMSFGVMPDRYKPVTTQLTNTSVEPVRQQIFKCLNKTGWSEERFHGWYNRVLNPITRVSERASLYDQELVHDCMDADDFKSFGVMPDAYKPVATQFTETLSVETTRQQIFECLNSIGWNKDRSQRWYNRVLNPITRVSERASIFDQELVGDCMDADDFISFGVMPDRYKPLTTKSTETFTVETVRQRILECLNSSGWSEDRSQRWYDRVLNPITRVSELVSLYDQDLVRHCINADDIKLFGVMPDGYQLTKVRPPGTLTVETCFREQTLNCLMMEGWTEDQTRQWYDGVLNPKTRSGRVTLLDQDLVRDCVYIDDFLKLGLIPDGYTPPPAPWQVYGNRPPQG